MDEIVTIHKGTAPTAILVPVRAQCNRPAGARYAKRGAVAQRERARGKMRSRPVVAALFAGVPLRLQASEAASRGAPLASRVIDASRLLLVLLNCPRSSTCVPSVLVGAVAPTRAS
jgi:hypothetical protein